MILSIDIFYFKTVIIGGPIIGYRDIESAANIQTQFSVEVVRLKFGSVCLKRSNESFRQQSSMFCYGYDKSGSKIILNDLACT